MDFPLNSDSYNFLSFYETAYAIASFYTLIYSDNQRTAKNILGSFLDQLESNFDVLNFEGSDEVKAVIAHFINFIKVDRDILDNEPKHAIQVCLDGIR
jgi:hypothetical protein